MTANKHTPGPWFVPDPKCFGIKSKVTGKWIPNTPENCQLMAAAPELLEALVDAIVYLQNHLPDEALAPHRAAVYKAMGTAA